MLTLRRGDEGISNKTIQRSVRPGMCGIYTAHIFTDEIGKPFSAFIRRHSLFVHENKTELICACRWQMLNEESRTQRRNWRVKDYFIWFPKATCCVVARHLSYHKYDRKGFR